MAKADQVVGCLIGGAIGDVMGGPYENEIGPVVVRDLAAKIEGSREFIATCRDFGRSVAT